MHRQLKPTAFFGTDREKARRRLGPGAPVTVPAAVMFSFVNKPTPVSTEPVASVSNGTELPPGPLATRLSGDCGMA